MSKRILVVEDQEDLRATLRDLLSTSGNTVIEAVDGLRGSPRRLRNAPTSFSWTFSCPSSTAMTPHVKSMRCLALPQSRSLP
jgi:CheY-like chemotaxis protein